MNDVLPFVRKGEKKEIDLHKAWKDTLLKVVTTGLLSGRRNRTDGMSGSMPFYSLIYES